MNSVRTFCCCCPFDYKKKILGSCAIIFFFYFWSNVRLLHCPSKCFFISLLNNDATAIYFSLAVCSACFLRVFSQMFWEFLLLSVAVSTFYDYILFFLNHVSVEMQKCPDIFNLHGQLDFFLGCFFKGALDAYELTNRFLLKKQTKSNIVQSWRGA